MGRWVTIDGRPVYIKDHARTVAAIATAVTLAALGGGSSSAVGASASGSGASVSADVGIRVNAKARDRSSRSVVRRLERESLRVRPRLELADDDCAAHSYGEVQSWLLDHPCDSLYRALFEVRDRRGGLVHIAVAWVDMPNEAQAVELKRLVDRHGTGNITELNRERGGQYRNVRFTGEHYASGHEDTTVINAQAEPVGGAARAVELTELARSAAG
jgi:hypothetical protein